MQNRIRMIVIMMVVAGLHLTGCREENALLNVEHPAEIVKIKGSDLSSVTLTDKAIQRLDLKTGLVLDQAGRIVVPFSSLIYDPHGQTWVYINPQPRTFVRHKVDVDTIKGNFAILNNGPPIGTSVATVAVAELYGAEYEIGH